MLPWPTLRSVGVNKGTLLGDSEFLWRWVFGNLAQVSFVKSVLLQMASTSNPGSVTMLDWVSLTIHSSLLPRCWYQLSVPPGYIINLKSKNVEMFLKNILFMDSWTNGHCQMNQSHSCLFVCLFFFSLINLDLPYRTNHKVGLHILGYMHKA